MRTWWIWLGIGAVLIALLFGALSSHEYEAGQWFVRNPYLGFSDDPTTSMVISWKTEQPVDGIVYYASQAAYEKDGHFTEKLKVGADSGTENNVYHVTLSGLAPDTHYVYQVKLKDGMRVAKSDLGEFWTASSALDQFTFTIYGDTRTHPERHRQVVEAMTADHPRFVVHTGDLVESGGVPYLWDQRFFWASAPLIKDSPYLAVLGNHEQNSPQYYEGFSLPPGGGEKDKEWWSMDYGVVHLVGLDTNALTLPHGFARMREQIAWLKDDLAAAKARGERFIFVFFHHPLFSSDAGYAPGNTGLRQLWHPVFKEYGVTAVFAGHCHNYERLVEDGVNYVVTGGGGAPLSGFLSEPVSGSLKQAEILHYTRVTISGDQATIEMIPVAKVEGDSVVPVSSQPFDTLVVKGE